MAVKPVKGAKRVKQARTRDHGRRVYLAVYVHKDLKAVIQKAANREKYSMNKIVERVLAEHFGMIGVLL